MAGLISKEILIAVLKDMTDSMAERGIDPSPMRVAMHTARSMPTIDAVPVIRCKDCKWFGKIGCAVNIVDESDEPKENDYCSWAEREE